ncbi:protein disulfide-isomerase [Babesia microti strain RI]|uniref:Protein disulfide-isomerase n=1 Tax=Babesia microti (strain RI) TaxID=1133968 RepID=A0A1R4A9U5_BABMR|nr:protein disulfide-isomerase [Babesia microti strain RI]SJK85772.1 protein disulfide-isomerase [Babesia microti strain RI]|eukprot:XP_021337995.1 protein disulfide-isomerase [Babesia microti strain RI]
MVLRCSIYGFYVLSLVFATGACGWEDEFKHITLLNDHNFVEFYKDKDVENGIFILFCSKEGSWSKIALKEYDMTAKILSKTNVKFGAMFPGDNDDFPINIELMQLPSLFHIHGVDVDIYRGTITHIEIMNWVLIKIVTELNINNVEALDAVLNVPESHEALTLIVAKNQIFSISKFIGTPSVVQLASICIFFYIDSPKVIERLEKTIYHELENDDRAFLKSGKSYIVVLRKFKYKSKAVVYKKSLNDLEAIVNFIKYESIPIIIEANSRMLPRLIEYEYKVVYIYTNEDDLKKVVSIEKIYNFFSDHHTDCVLAHLSSNNIENSPIINMLGIDLESVIVVRAIWKDVKTGKIRKYQPQDFGEQAFDYERFFIFMRKLIDNQLQPYFKSQPSIPKEIDTGPVKTIVGSDFYDRVLNSSEDVLLMIYATWCGHCHKVRPVWRQLGLLLQNVKNIIVAKLDGVNNEVDDIYITYFPTIRMYPHGQKSQPIDFKMDITIENLLDFAEKTAGIAKFDTNNLINSISPEPLFEKYTEL